MKESELIRKISEYLKSVPDLFFWKEHGGMYGTAGIPDLIVCYRGRFIGLECKVGKNEATVLQSLTIPPHLAGGKLCDGGTVGRGSKTTDISL